MFKLISKFEKSQFFAWFLLTISALLFTIGMQLFIQTAKILSSGIASIVNLITIIVPDLSPYFTIIYFIINIPIILLFFNKLKKAFVIKTFYFLCLQAILGFLFSLFEIKSLVWNTLSIDPLKAQSMIWPIFFLSFLGAFVNGIAIGLAWKSGGSTAGIDIFTQYLSFKKKKNIGNIFLIINLSFTMFSFLITLFFKKIFTGILMGSIIYVFVVVFLVERIYPKYSKIWIEIHSKNIDLIIKEFENMKFWHPYQIREVYSGLFKKKKKIITTMILLLEYKDINKKLLKIDPDIWLSCIIVNKQQGKFNFQSID